MKFGLVFIGAAWLLLGLRLALRAPANGADTFVAAIMFGLGAVVLVAGIRMFWS